MANCPVCQNKLQTDFGNEVCSKCGTTVFVESDDIVHVQDLAAMDAALNQIKENDSDLNSINDTGVSENRDQHNLDDQTEDDLFGIGHSDNDLPSFETDEIIQSVSDSLLESEIISDGTNDILAEDNLSPEDEIVDPIFNSEPVAQIQAETTTAEDFLSEMQLLGDMASEKFKESNYFFDIEIKGIDSKDVRDEILDHLFDSRLGLKENNLDKKIKNGFLTLNDVSAIKTHVIVQRLSHLPCEISWKIKEAHELGAANDEVLVETDVEDLSALEVDDFTDLEET